MAVPVSAVETDVQYRQIFDAVSDGLVVNDPDTGVVVEVNPAFCRMHGYTYDELIGMHPTAFIHPDDHAIFAAFLDAFHSGGTFAARARDVRKDGSVLDVEVRAEAFVFRGKRHLLGVVRDVSATVQAQRLLEQRVDERTRELAALLEVARHVAATRDIDELMRVTVEQVRAIIDCDGATVYLRRGDAYTLERGDGTPTAASVPRAALPRIGADLDAGRALLVWDDATDGLPEEAAAAGLRPPGTSVILVPLVAQGQPVGFLSSHRVCDDHEGAPRAMALLEAIAHQVAIAVTNVRLAEGARVAAALDERHRIARDLHDAVSQTLFSTTMHARAAELAVARLGLDEEHPARRHVADVAGLTLGALAEMRSLIFELRPGALAEAGLAVALDKHAAALTARHGLAVDVRVPDERLPLDADVEEALYRIAQEALANVVRHADASQVTVEAWRSEHAVVLRVTDDGCGFDPAADHPGHLGLHTMRERAAQARARLEVASTPGCGTTVTVRAPVAKGRR